MSDLPNVAGGWEFLSQGAAILPASGGGEPKGDTPAQRYLQVGDSSVPTLNGTTRLSY